MKILITNFRLAERTASEAFVSELAEALKGAGHEVGLFVSNCGKAATELEEAGIEVQTHPKALSFRPDIIHGQHNLETMAALLEFPDRPAVYVSHGTKQWREFPPMHPRILRYLGTSVTMRDWLEREVGVDGSRFVHIPDFIDVNRFEHVRKLEEVPRKALYFDQGSGAGQHMSQIREACRRCGIELTLVDDLIGREPTRPEVLLPRYDLVFASGRAAMEAIVAGCGVIVARDGRWGAMVTAANYDAMRERHFGVSDGNPGDLRSADDLVREIEKWDWQALGPVTRRAREEMRVESLSEQLLEIYRGAIEETADWHPSPKEEMASVANWLIQLADQHHLIDSGFLTIQHRASAMRHLRQESEERLGELERLLAAEKEKVRVARRMLKDGNLVHQRLRKRLESEWREIEHDQQPGKDEVEGAASGSGAGENGDAAPAGGSPSKGAGGSGSGAGRFGIELPQ